MSEEYLLTFRVYNILQNGIAFLNSSGEVASLYFAGYGGNKPGFVMHKDGKPVFLNLREAEVLKKTLRDQFAALGVKSA